MDDEKIFLFEKRLVHSDVKNRLRIPKKAAEVYLPDLSRGQSQEFKVVGDDDHEWNIRFTRTKKHGFSFENEWKSCVDAHNVKAGDYFFLYSLSPGLSKGQYLVRFDTMAQVGAVREVVRG